MLKITPKRHKAVTLSSLQPGDCFITTPIDSFVDARPPFIFLLLAHEGAPKEPKRLVARIYGDPDDTTMPVHEFEGIDLYPVNVEMIVSPG